MSDPVSPTPVSPPPVSRRPVSRRIVLGAAAACAAAGGLGLLAASPTGARLRLIAACIGRRAYVSGAVHEFLAALAEEEAETGVEHTAAGVLHRFVMSTTIAAYERGLGPLEFTGLYRIGDASCANQLAAQAAPDLPA